jgi:hypothetical protein
LEIPFAGFVAEEVHGEIDSDTPERCGEEEEDTLGDALIFPFCVDRRLSITITINAIILMMPIRPIATYMR